MSKNEKIFHDRLFPRLEKHKYNLLKIDTASISYITTPSTAKQICNIIKKYFNEHKIQMESIVDCTACVGGDTIALASIFNEVLSVEIETNTYNMLENNVHVYDLKNVKLFNDDCLQLLKRIEYVQAVYFDPPWGGSDYKSMNKLRLFIGSESIEKIAVDLMCRRYTKKPPKFMIFKLPKNYDIHYFFTNVTIKDEVSIYLHKLKKINVIIVMNHYIDNDVVLIE